MNTISEIFEEVHQINEQAWIDRNKDLREAIRLAQQAQALLESCAEANPREMAASLRTQAYCQDQLDQCEAALTNGLKGMALAEQSGDTLMIAMLDKVLGNVHWRLDDYTTAINHYLHGLELLQKTPDPELEVYMVQGVGLVYYALGIYDEALKYFQLSVEMAFPEEGIGRMIGLNNIACTLTDMKRGEEALPYALKARELFERSSFSIANVLHTLGTVYQQIGSIDQALRYYEEAAEISNQQANGLQIANALLGICSVYQARGELDLAREKLLTVLKVAKSIGSPASQVCSAHEMLAGIYKQMGDYKTALEHQETFHAIYVQHYNADSYRRIHNAQVLHQVETFRKQADLYRTLAATDTLTGLLSRREFFELGAKALLDAQSRQAPLSLLMIDVDYFKQVNDQYGHPVGDQVLALIAARLKKALRHHDLAGRYGGDEFVILLSDTGARQGQRIAERCRREIAESPIQLGALSLALNISAGLAVFDPGSTAAAMPLEELIQQADQALLAAKRNGRNSVMLSAG